MDHKDFKRGDLIYIGSFKLAKAEFIKDFGEYFSCCASKDGPNYWWEPIGKTRNEALDALIIQIINCRD